MRCPGCPVVNDEKEDTEGDIHLGSSHSRSVSQSVHFPIIPHARTLHNGNKQVNTAITSARHSRVYFNSKAPIWWICSLRFPTKRDEDFRSLPIIIIIIIIIIIMLHSLPPLPLFSTRYW